MKPDAWDCAWSSIQRVGSSKSHPTRRSNFARSMSACAACTPGRRPGVHIVRTPDPGKTAKQFYDTLGSGGVEKPLPGGKGWRSRFDDGSSVVYRPSSKSGSPAVEITVNTAKGDRYKIHFEH